MESGESPGYYFFTKLSMASAVVLGLPSGRLLPELRLRTLSRSRARSLGEAPLPARRVGRAESESPFRSLGPAGGLPSLCSFLKSM